jgi:biotin synthase
MNEISGIFFAPLMELSYAAATMHRRYFDPQQVQQCTLLSIKTGGCGEDCKYCSQSARYQTAVDAEPLLDYFTTMEAAKAAKDAGSTRFCMGAAWRGVSAVNENSFSKVLDMVKGVSSMGMECCATLGMLTEDQAVRLKDAGLTAYNHNLDTSPEFYSNVITTRTYADRLETIGRVRDAGISVCSGGIIGLGESHQDRISLLHQLATLPSHPESTPVNALVPNEGTPFGNAELVSVFDMVRMIATARLIMPQTMVRLSAGRNELTAAEQAMCFSAGANSIFAGDKLLTTANPAFSDDKDLFELLGLSGKPAILKPGVKGTR